MQPASPSLVNNIKDKLSRDEVVLSMFVRLVSSVEIVRMIQTAGYDSFYVDLEHSSFSLETASQICLTALSAGITPLIRVPTLQPEVISRVLDAGAMGVIAPHVKSAADAMLVVSAAKYPPHGRRSAGGPLPHTGYWFASVDQANRSVDQATTVVVMIETKEALDHVDEIAAVDGVDILLVGTGDLSADLGIPGMADHHLINDAYTHVLNAARRHGKHVGIGGMGGRPHLIEKHVRAGARYVSAGADFDFLLTGARERAASLRSLRSS